jgi:hypothetical protein
MEAVLQSPITGFGSPTRLDRHFRERPTLGVHMHSRPAPLHNLIEMAASGLAAHQLEEAIAFGIILEDNSTLKHEFNFFIPIACRYAQLHGLPATGAIFDRLSPDQKLPIFEKLAPLMNSEDLELALDRIMGFADGGSRAPIVRGISSIAEFLLRLDAARRYRAWTDIDRLTTVRAEVASMFVAASGPLIKTMVGAEGLPQVALAMS